MKRFLDSVESKLGRCLHCQRKALHGAILLWVLAVLVAIFGDWRQLVAAVGLAAGSLTVLWLAHRAVFAIRRARMRHEKVSGQSLLVDGS
jgi:hypothetical protein